MAESTDAIEARNGNDQSGDNPTLPIGLGRRTGRPPGSKNKNRPVDFGFEKEAPPKRDTSTEQMESAKFIGEALVQLVELGESFVHNSCTNKIDQKRPDKSAEFRKMVEGFKLKDKEREMMSSSATKIAVRHEWVTKFAPELVLGIVLSQFSLRQLSLMKFVNNICADRKPTPAPQPPPLPASPA